MWNISKPKKPNWGIFLMKYRYILPIILFALFSLLPAQEFPAPQGWVNDFARVLSAETVNELTEWFTELKEKTDVEFAVAIFPNLGEKDYNDFATDLFREWGVGSKRDEGILLLVSVQERKIKFEVGYASEAYLTDLYTAQAYRTMTTFLRIMTKRCGKRH